MAIEPPMLQLAKVIARSMASANPSADPQKLGDALSSDPASVCQVVDLIFSQSARKRPAGKTLEALAYMLAATLEVERWKAEGRGLTTTDLIDQVHQHVSSYAREDKVSPLAIDMIAGAFARARVPLGGDLEEALEKRFSNTPSSSSEADPAGFEKHLEEMASALGDDPFLLHEQLRELLGRIPPQTRPAMLGVLPFMRNEAVREAAAGWVLDHEDPVFQAVSDSLSQAAAQGLMSGNTVNRLIQIRNWIAEDKRPAVDSIIRTARQKGAASSVTKRLLSHEVVMTAPDGAGAQSIHIRLRQRKGSSFANILLKHGFGIREAWISPEMTQTEADAFLDRIFVEMDAYETSLESFKVIVRHGLAVTMKSGSQIPFELLRIVEALDLDPVTPEFLDTAELVELIMTEVGANGTTDSAIKKAIAASRHWSNEHLMFDSWFEDLADDQVHAIPKGNKANRQRHVLETLINPRRGRWGELLAWGAFAMSEEDPDLAFAMAINAKLFLGEAPLEELPLAMMIADNTLAAAQHR
jgi:hypothetical protein